MKLFIAQPTGGWYQSGPKKAECWEAVLKTAVCPRRARISWKYGNAGEMNVIHEPMSHQRATSSAV